MQIQLARSATLRIEDAQHTLLIDPYLAAKYTRPSFAGKSPNPLVDLPCPPLEVIAKIEMVIVSHVLHANTARARFGKRWKSPSKLGITSARVEVFCHHSDTMMARALEAGAV